MSEAQPRVGSTANSYVILAKLATGGMAELFLAKNASGAGIERYVVLKRVLGHRANDAALVSMFLDEARLAAQLQHPNIAQVYDTGVLGDSHFFTMEYVHGETVREILRRAYDRELQIPIGVVLTMILHASAGLDHAHDRVGMDGEPLGIVHRDVSPSNLMVTYEGHVKLVDFGVAKAARSTSETQSGTVKGKVAYMSPEQCRGRTVDRRSDLFSLGIVMWEVLAGDRLFKRATDYENMEAIVREDAPRLSERRPGIPPAVEHVVDTLLQKNPIDRYQSANQLIEAIEAAAHTAGVQLSTASVARFMRELFGTRREPWLDMLPRDPALDAITVTAAPVADPNVELTNARLAKLPELRTVSSDVAVDPTPETSSAMPPRRPQRRARRLLWIALVFGGAGVGLGAVTLAHNSTPSTTLDAGMVGSAALDHALAPPPPLPRDAAVAASIDAPPPPLADDGSATAAPLQAHHDHPHPHAPPADELAQAVRGERHADVVRLCASSSELAAKNAGECTRAACQLHQASAARRWLALAPRGDADELIAACRAAGTELARAAEATHGSASVPPPHHTATPDCDADPMACRH